MSCLLFLPARFVRPWGGGGSIHRWSMAIVDGRLGVEPRGLRHRRADKAERGVKWVLRRVWHHSFIARYVSMSRSRATSLIRSTYR